MIEFIVFTVIFIGVAGVLMSIQIALGNGSQPTGGRSVDRPEYIPPSGSEGGSGGGDGGSGSGW